MKWSCIVFMWSIVSTTGLGVLSSEPPQLRFPIGMEEYQRTGKIPEEFSVSVEDGVRSVLMKSEYPEFPSVSLRFKENVPHINFRQPALGKLPTSDFNFTLDGVTVSPQSGDIIPIFGELYKVRIHASQGVTLTRITEMLPARLKPGSENRVVSSVEVEPRLFWSRIPSQRTCLEFDVLRFEERSETTVGVKLTPFSSGTSSDCLTSRSELKLDFDCQQSNVVRGCTFKVKNISPESFPEHGRCVGWIELAPVKEAREN